MSMSIKNQVLHENNHQSLSTGAGGILEVVWSSEDSRPISHRAFADGYSALCRHPISFLRSSNYWKALILPYRYLLGFLLEQQGLHLLPHSLMSYTAVVKSQVYRFATFKDLTHEFMKNRVMKVILQVHNHLKPSLTSCTEWGLCNMENYRTPRDLNLQIKCLQ